MCSAYGDWGLLIPRAAMGIAGPGNARGHPATPRQSGISYSTGRVTFAPALTGRHGSPRPEWRLAQCCPVGSAGRKPRPRRSAGLDQGLTRPLTLISAPAGFGKTTLLSEWRASRAGRGFPLAWLSLDNDDNDPTRFLSYLVGALAALRGGVGETTIASPAYPLPPQLQPILINLLSDLGP